VQRPWIGKKADALEIEKNAAENGGLDGEKFRRGKTV